MGRLVEKNVAGIRLLGFSLAGEETVVAAPELNVCFDVGRAPREIISIDTVCVSHGHMDHAAGVAYYFSQRGFVGAPAGRVVVHRALAQHFQQLMAVWADIEGHPSPGEVIGVHPLADVPIRRGLAVRPFAVEHGAYALGYSLIESRHKLKPEHAGKTGPQLVELKKRGVEIEDRIEVPLITYTGDTAVGRFLDLPFVRQTRVLILECTFFERDHVSRARAGYHIHIVDLPEVLAAVPDAHILITHVTRRTDLRQAMRIFERAVPAREQERISFLMDRPSKRAFTGQAPPRNESPMPDKQANAGKPR